MKPGTYIHIVETFEHPPARVWRTLTRPDLMAKWLMPNDFRLEVGHEFTFRGPPIPRVGHDGTAHCKVLDFAVERFLTISFKGSGPQSLDSTITWTLEPKGSGTQVSLLHHGFDPDNPFHRESHRLMSSGWPGVLRGLGELAGSEEAA